MSEDNVMGKSLRDGPEGSWHMNEVVGQQIKEGRLKVSRTVKDVVTSIAVHGFAIIDGESVIDLDLDNAGADAEVCEAERIIKSKDCT